MKKKFVEVEGTIKVKIKKKFVAFLWAEHFFWHRTWS